MQKRKSKEDLIKEIYALEKKASQLRKELKGSLKKGEQGTGVIIITDTEDGAKYHCSYKSVKGTHSSILTRLDRVEKNGITTGIVIPLYESIPTEDKRKNLAGYQRLGKSKIYVPQYLALDWSHLVDQRRKRKRTKGEEKHAQLCQSRK